MTKFGKSKKMDHPISYSRTSGFDRFRGGPRTRDKLKDFKIQGCFEAWK
jgi:hypothetical protein